VTRALQRERDGRPVRAAERERGAALPAALVVVGVALALGSAVADLMHTQAVLARNRRTAARALAKADGCLAHVVAAMPAGWTFDAELAGPDGVAGTADDGQLAAPAGCTVVADTAPGPVDPPRTLLAVEGRDGGGRRLLDAVVRRRDAPGVDAVLWLEGGAMPGTIGGSLTLDGRDPLEPFAPPWAAVAAPLDPATLDAWIAGNGGRVDVAAPTPAPIAVATPSVAALVARAVAAGAVPGAVLSPAPPATPALALVTGDLAVATPSHGAGVLVIQGRLDIQAPFAFTGLLVAADGVRVTHAGRLDIAGALWIGSGVLEPLEVDGVAHLVASAAGLQVADAMLPLPRRAVVAGVHDPG
jgi:hypothetical protein